MEKFRELPAGVARRNVHSTFILMRRLPIWGRHNIYKGLIHRSAFLTLARAHRADLATAAPAGAASGRLACGSSMGPGMGKGMTPDDLAIPPTLDASIW